MAFCSKCGAQLNSGAGFCGACGAAVAAQGATPSPGASAAATPAPQPAVASPGMTNNLAGALCYIGFFITGIIFLVMEPYSTNRFVRFHAFQSIFFSVVCIVFSMVWSWVFVSLLFTPGMALWGFLALVWVLIRLGMFAAWIFLMYKAYNNEEFKLPIIGDLAAKQLGS